VTQSLFLFLLSRVNGFCLFILSASIAAIKNLSPYFFPLLAPAKGTPAGLADFGREI